MDVILGKKIEPSPLRFNFTNDAIRYADEVVEEFNCRLVENKVPNVVKAYRSVQLDIVIRLRSAASNPCERYLVFRAKLGHILNQSRAVTLVRDLTRKENSANEMFMFTDVGQLVHSPEGFIPSFVWLKRSHEIKDFLGNVFGSIGSTILDFSGGAAEGKVGFLSGLSGGDGSGATELIESRAKILDSVERQSGDSQWQRLNQSDVLKVVSCIKRVWLSENSVWLTLKESLRKDFNFVDVRLGMIDGEARAC